MKTNVKAVPDGYHAITSVIMVQGAGQEIDFLKKAFNALESARMTAPDGTIMHAELKIGDSMLMVGEAKGKWQPMPSCQYLYVENVDAVYQRALKYGAVSQMEPQNMFWGDRHASVRDPSGNHWGIATHIEDVSPEEMKKRGEAWMKAQTC